MKKIFLIILILLLIGCGNNSNDMKLPPDNETETDESQIYLESLTLEEKVGQLFLVRCPDDDQLELYMSMNPGGFILFGKDFKDKTKEEVANNIKTYQSMNNTPMIIGVDEEGGTVVRVSSNPLLSEERFKSPQELYSLGGFDVIKKDTTKKSKLLKELGINLNLAPVADVSVNPNDFINPRAFGKNAIETAEYIKTVVKEMKSNRISGTLKHFPGYGDNIDTHTGSAYDKRPYETFVNSDFIPFKAGIESGIESILVSHNVVEAIDPKYPASLSNKVINILRNDLKFEGIIMTDDLAMGAIQDLSENLSPEILAINAGNDMLIVTDFENSYNVLLTAVKNGDISMDRINESVLRIIKWKYEMGIM